MLVRRAAADDGDAIVELYAGLSDRSRQLRFLHPTPRITSELRRTLTDVDSAHVWLAFHGDRCVGEARIAPDPHGEGADLAVTVADSAQGHGVGRRLARAAVEDGRSRYRTLTVTIDPDNAPAIRMARRGGVPLRFDGGVLEGRIPLHPRSHLEEVSMLPRHDHKIDQLAELELFRGCSHRQLRELARLTTELEVARGTVVCREGAAGKECFVVRDGEATVSIAGEPVATVGPGELFGELAVLDGERRVATVTAVTDMALLVLSRHDFAVLLDTMPSVSRRILQVVGARLRATDHLLRLSA